MIKVKVEGLRELERALAELPTKAAGKAVLRRVGLKAIKPVAEKAAALAPIDADPRNTPKRAPGTLKRSYVAGTRLNRRQARMARKEGKSDVEVYAGTNDPAGVQTEFGNAHQGAQPHLRPAWDQEAGPTLVRVVEGLRPEIEKTAARLAKRAAKGK